MSFEFVRADVLRNVQGRLIERYGGLRGVRDSGALESAIARPENLVAYGSVESAAVLAAALAWAILRNDPFVDGNKRAAFAAMSMFLELNGYRLTCSEVEETAMVLAAAAEMYEGEWMEWVRRSVGAV